MLAPTLGYEYMVPPLIFQPPPPSPDSYCTVPDCPVSDVFMQFRKLAGSVATDFLIYDYLSAPTIQGIVEYSSHYSENHD